MLQLGRPAVSNAIIGGTATGATALPVANSIDAVNDYLPIYTSSVTATQAINRNTLLNLASQPVGISDTQTLTNKTITSPTVSGPTLSGTIIGTYTIGGTPTFPASVVSLTGSQTLTNKTLTSPTINSPSITNATITADVYAGYTVSNTGTILGMSVTTGVIASAALAGAVNTAAIATNAVTAAKLSTSAITLGLATLSSGNFTTTNTSATAITDLSVGVTIPAGGRYVKVTVFAQGVTNTTAGDGCQLTIWSGATSAALTTQLAATNIYQPTSLTTETPGLCIAILQPSAGAIYYTAALNAVTGGTATVVAGSSSAAFILVEAI